MKILNLYDICNEPKSVVRAWWKPDMWDGNGWNIIGSYKAKQSSTAAIYCEGIVVRLHVKQETEAMVSAKLHALDSNVAFVGVSDKKRPNLSWVLLLLWLS